MESQFLELVTAVRTMLREDFAIADNRDLAVAAAVNNWYLAQFPFLAARADKPDLAHIISKVRHAQPVHEQLMLPGVPVEVTVRTVDGVHSYIVMQTISPAHAARNNRNYQVDLFSQMLTELTAAYDRAHGATTGKDGAA